MSFDLIAWVLNCSCVGFFRAGKKQRSQNKDIGIVTGKKVAWRMKILNTWMGTLMSYNFGLSILILMHFLSQKNFGEMKHKIDVALFLSLSFFFFFFFVGCCWTAYEPFRKIFESRWIKVKHFKVQRWWNICNLTFLIFLNQMYYLKWWKVAALIIFKCCLPKV